MEQEWNAVVASLDTSPDNAAAAILACEHDIFDDATSPAICLRHAIVHRVLRAEVDAAPLFACLHAKGFSAAGVFSDLLTARACSRAKLEEFRASFPEFQLCSTSVMTAVTTGGRHVLEKLHFLVEHGCNPRASPRNVAGTPLEAFHVMRAMVDEYTGEGSSFMPPADVHAVVHLLQME
jgi:hypothetical protein